MGVDAIRMPSVYLGHGAPPLVEDEFWPTELSAWSSALPRPTAILVVSAHWESAPLTIGATQTGVPLHYDFYGFAQHNQISMPTLDPTRLLELGKRLAPLRDEGVLIIGSGVLTHGLPYISFGDPHGEPPSWSTEFDLWTNETPVRTAICYIGRLDTDRPIANYKSRWVLVRIGETFL